MKTSWGMALAVFLIIISSAHATGSEYDIVLVRGDPPVDLVVAQVYTQSRGIPLVTVQGNGLSSAHESELKGYSGQNYRNALIIGGEEAVSSRVEQELGELGFEVTRIWDWNRYGTAARAAVSLWEESNVVVVTNGDQSGSLLSAARAAIDFSAPLLLTETNELPSETKIAIGELGANRIVIIGNVSEGVRSELGKLGGVEHTQLSLVEREEPGSAGIFVVGAVIGGLFIFLLSSLLGVGVVRKRARVPYDILEDDEQKIIDLIDEGKGKLKQQDLPRLTGFSRPKVSREVTELIGRGIVEKEKKGKTYVLKMGKKVQK